MVRFGKYVKKERKVDPTDLVALFESGDRHATHTELRPAQRETLKALSARLDSRDVVLKVSTGAGKTTAGLIYLQSQMERTGDPVVYLCPTVQLVEQVCAEATRIGLKTTHYAAGESHPDVAAMRGKLIVVCTYDKLFNGRSSFDRPDVNLRPAAIVLDDSHAGIDRIRAQFRLSFARGSPLGMELIGLLGPACSQQYPGAWPGIINEDQREWVEVPYWTWASILGDARDLIGQEVQEQSDGKKPKDGSWFTWPLVRDALRWCRCVVSGARIELTPIVLPVDRCRAFSECPHRLFMSATLADDAALVRDLGCSVEAVESPICPETDRGLGERMVLAPSLIDPSLDRQWLAKACASIAKRYNVVVLTPSESMAEAWTEAGAEFVKEGEVASLVKELRTKPQGRFVALAQRYDGVDLPDDACRVLVLDGLPLGESLTDDYDSARAGHVRRRLVHRIEQGMGRAVRSHVDYAVVILAGSALAHFVAQKRVLEAMNPDARAQLALAVDDLVEVAKDEGSKPDRVFLDMVKKCLDRDPEWKQYYRERIREADRIGATAWRATSLPVAEAVWRAISLASSNDARGGADVLDVALKELSGDAAAGLRQLLANVTHEFDAGAAAQIQRSAFESDRSLLCPASSARPVRQHSNAAPAEIVRAWYEEFENANGAVAAVEDFRSRLGFSRKPKSFEQALAELARLVGAEGSRPEAELCEGPDVLWLWSDASLVIEAKNQSAGVLSKRDAGQLALSLQWFDRSYPTRASRVPIVVAPQPIADRLSDFPHGTRVMTPDSLGELLRNLGALYEEMVREPHKTTTTNKLAARLTALVLASDRFVATYTEPLRGR